MRVLDTLAAVDAARSDALLVEGGSVVAIGKFDGIHRGHHAILDRVRAAAPLHSVVFTFANNPLSLLKPDTCPRPLMSGEQRLEAFADEGIELCAMVEFDEAFAAIPAEEFVERTLVGGLNARRVVLGADFRFGRGGAGDAALLRRMGERLGFDVEVVEWVTDDAAGQVSSSRIREAMTSGDVAAAARMLGRPPAVRGEVVHGDARGRELGFPTANLGGRVEGFVPADGVYAGWAVVDGARYAAAVSVGVNLTFESEGEPRVEAFLLDFSGDLYGARIEVLFVERLRGMERYDTLEALVEQMGADVERTREIAAGTASA